MGKLHGMFRRAVGYLTDDFEMEHQGDRELHPGRGDVPLTPGERAAAALGPDWHDTVAPADEQAPLANPAHDI